MNIQTGAMGIENLHASSFCAAGLEPPFRKSKQRAAGLLPALDTIRGAQGLRVRLTDGLERTKIQTDLAAADAPAPYPQRPQVSFPAGRKPRWPTNRRSPVPTPPAIETRFRRWQQSRTPANFVSSFSGLLRPLPGSTPLGSVRNRSSWRDCAAYLPKPADCAPRLSTPCYNDHVAKRVAGRSADALVQIPRRDRLLPQGDARAGRGFPIHRGAAPAPFAARMAAE